MPSPITRNSSGPRPVAGWLRRIVAGHGCLADDCLAYGCVLRGRGPPLARSIFLWRIIFPAMTGKIDRPRKWCRALFGVLGRVVRPRQLRHLGRQGCLASLWRFRWTWGLLGEGEGEGDGEGDGAGDGVDDTDGVRWMMGGGVVFPVK